MAGLAPAATVFQDEFESGPLSPSWEIFTTGDGRVRTSAEHGPATGQGHMVLDDSVSDALYSSANATIRIDLLNKRNVMLSFKAKSLGNEPDDSWYSSMGLASENFDGVSFSHDGGVTWRYVSWLGNVSTDWETFSFRLDDYLGGSVRFGSDFRIRFSEFDNAPAPLDGIAFDDVLVTADIDQRAVLELPSQITEGAGPHTGFVLLTFAPTNDVTLNLVVSPADQLALPATVQVPAGKTYASFSFSALNDELVTLSRTIYLRADAPGFRSVQSAVTILDDDVPVATLVIPPQLTEGDYSWHNASVTLDRPADVPISLEFEMEPWGEIDLWYDSSTIPAGETSIAFTIRASDDDRIDGTVPVAVTLKIRGMAPVTAHTTTFDNDTRALSLILPSTMLEGRFADAALELSASLSTDTQVHLTSANSAALSVPASLTIRANERRVDFTIKAPDNLIHDGSRDVAISAAASAFSNAVGTVTVRDNDVATYLFSGLTDIVDLDRPLSLMIYAADKEGNIINFGGNVSLSLVQDDGTIQTVTPSTVRLSGLDGWSGEITLPPASSSPLRLRATDTNGVVSDSIAFDTLRTLDLAAADLVWDAVRGRFYASVPGENGGTNANRVVIIDPLTAQVLGGVAAGQNPGRLVLTGESEFLYVALDGNGTIARINPATMMTNLTFAVGTSAIYGTLYAADLCAVAGQPELLVVSQKRKNASPEHNGVAVYDNGVARPVRTQELAGSNVVEPSADPGIFFGFSTDYDNGFRRLRLDSSGMTEIENIPNLFQSYGNDIRSDGNKVFSTSGAEVDGAQMRRLGTFPASGLVCPELVASRVFFLESDSYWYPYDKIGVYDSVTFSNIRRLKLPAAATSPRSFIRWGTNGLAFITGTNVVLINSQRLVSSDPPANLAVTVNATPSPAAVSTPLLYTVTVTNQGPNLAKHAFLTVTLSDGQAIRNIAAPFDTSSTSSRTLVMEAGELAAGASVTLALTTLPDSAGMISCQAVVASAAPDPDFTDNLATNRVSVGFQTTLNTVSRLRLAANNLIYDVTRNLLWASLPATVEAPFGNTVVSIDPSTGLISAPIPINGNPVAQCMAISKNGRYLFVGLSDTNQVHRIDLKTPSISLRVPLGLNTWGSPSYAQDIEPLDGAGTSFLMTSSSDQSAAVYDGTLRRPGRTDNSSVSYIEQTGTPGVFVGLLSGYQLSTLFVTSAGVTNVRQVANVISGYNTEIRGAGNLVLSSYGQLVDGSNLTLVATLGANLYGRPCLDMVNHRAYLVQGYTLKSFDTATFLPKGSFELPFYADSYWSPSRPELCIRWGLDGFAYLHPSGNIYLWRWSETIPASVDANADGMSDAWEAAHFNTLAVAPAGDDDGDGIRNFLEYLFVTSPTQASTNPVQISTATDGEQTFLRLIFPRRAGLSPQPYDYVTSTDLTLWAPALNVSETVLATQTVDGVQVETVEALIPASNPVAGFVRIRWNPQ